MATIRTKVTYAELAADVVDRAFKERYEPSTRDIMDDYEIGETTVAKVKKAAKEYAAEQYGAIWGYHPERNKFVLVPDEGGQETANSVLGYAATQVANSAHMARVQFRAGWGQEYVTDAGWKRARNALSSIIRLADDVTP